MKITMLLLVTLVASVKAGPYYELMPHPSSDTLRISGDIKVAASTPTYLTPVITLKGADGSITALGDITGLNIRGNGSFLTGIPLPDLSAIALATTSLRAQVNAVAVDTGTITTALNGKLSNTATVSPSLIDLSTVTAAINAKPGDNLGTHIATKTITAGYGISASTLTATSSVTAYNVTVSSTVCLASDCRSVWPSDSGGITSGSTTTWTGSNTFATVTASSFTATNATINGIEYSNYAPFAWADLNLSATPSIVMGVNISSVTYIGTGHFMINFDTDAPSNVFSFSCTAGKDVWNNGFFCSTGAKYTSGAEIGINAFTSVAGDFTASNSSSHTSVVFYYKRY